MSRCPHCRAELLVDAGACPGCGQPIGEPESAQRPAPPAPTVPDTAAGLGSESAPRAAPADAAESIEGDSLAPGTVLDDRYRIVARLGAGGMGAVYRAEDLRLRHEVALKFLSGQCAIDDAGNAALLNEARLARRVTHPNVCRVHDIGEFGGCTFISMEYVDGEDLGSLLRRIGRPSGDKAVQIARQLCSGLWAAHEQGVLHRDLKPQNVMIDGRGNVRITDFGIAGLVAPDGAEEGASGTPAYMAPELFTGGGATVQSDLYSLGLVLYELYTGGRLFRASTMTELLKQHRRPVPPPSEAVPGIDHDVEAVILRCLERDPARRPTSVLSVLAALPGTDPLAQALARGETPSPELVAESRAGWDGCRTTVTVLAAVFLLALAAVFWLDPKVKLIARTPLPESAEVLASRARDHIRELGDALVAQLGGGEVRDPEARAAVVARLGLAVDGAHRAYGFDVFHEFLDGMRTESRSFEERAARVAEGRPAAIDFWYRQSPRPLIARHISGKVTWADPPYVSPGMAQVRLDPDGVLRELLVVPTAGWLRLTDPMEPRADWDPLFRAAGLDPARFEGTEPTRVLPAFADRRAAWREKLPADTDRAERRLTVEAASLRGLPVAFQIVAEEWVVALADGAPRRQPAGSAFAASVKFVSLLAAAVLAWRALRRGRGDRVGAFRFVLAIFVLVFAVTMLTGSHSGNAGAEGQLLLSGMARGLLVAAQYWVFYIALEPHVRRIWPETIVAWTRVLRGSWRDPLVGFNVLAGQVLGVVITALVYAAHLGHGFVGEAPPIRDRTLEALLGAPASFGAFLEIVSFNAGVGMSFLLGLVLLRYLLRSRLVGAAVYSVVYAAVLALAEADTAAWQWAIYLVVAAAATLVAVRVGLLALMLGLFTYNLLASFPLRGDPSSWQAGSTLFAISVVVGLVAFGAATAVRQRA